MGWKITTHDYSLCSIHYFRIYLGPKLSNGKAGVFGFLHERQVPPRG